MSGTTDNRFLDTNDPARLLTGARHAAQLASNLADAAFQWAESTQTGFEAAHEARAAAMLARSVVETLRESEPLLTLRIAAADAWEAVQRAMDASQRVVAVVPVVRG